MPPLPDDASREEHVLHSWQRNAQAWADTVHAGLIESRRLVTNDAIVQAVLDSQAGSVLDLGCGEGWLVRALAAASVDARGVDAIPALIERARATGGDFVVASYEDIVDAKLQLEVDAIVCNFALLGKESVAQLLASLPRLLRPDGRLIVQTVHPLMACGETAYADGWREEEWVGFGAAFPAPAPWYFRTMASWLALLASTGWRLVEMREPLHPLTGKPASVIFIAQRK